MHFLNIVKILFLLKDPTTEIIIRNSFMYEYFLYAYFNLYFTQMTPSDI